MGTDQTVPAISVVVPLLDEEGSLAELAEALNRVLAGIGSAYEIIFVDDGSSDASFSILEEQSRRFPAVSVVRLRRNFGKSTALDVGFNPETAVDRLSASGRPHPCRVWRLRWPSPVG